MEVEMAHNLRRDYEKGADRMSALLRQRIESGRRHSAFDYLAATAAVEPLNRALDGLFDEFDAIITPAAPGAAPRGLEATGDPVFCSTWTLLGTPALTLPLIEDKAGLPIGIQVVGRRHNDGRLLRTARWLAERLTEQSGRGRKRKTAARSCARGKNSRTRT
jgi:Asp-tRNA(Asn)/Glu-tRNA(Gln) amidotransferase A subunit family amidase